MLGEIFVGRIHGWEPLLVSQPYYSHTNFPSPEFAESLTIWEYIVWEAYEKGVPLLGVPGINIESSCGAEVDMRSRKKGNTHIYTSWILGFSWWTETFQLEFCGEMN